MSFDTSTVGAWDWVIRFVVCGLWFVVCGLWFVVCGLWFVVCGLWFVLFGSGVWVLVLPHHQGRERACDNESHHAGQPTCDVMVVGQG